MVGAKKGGKMGDTSELGMRYFVLKPKGDSKYAQASRGAMLAYAGIIMDENRGLAMELTSWVYREQGRG